MYKFTFYLSLIIITLSHPTFSVADIINVPDDFDTIQEGIDEAEDGDTVLVAPGEYRENIDFLGKAITVSSLILTTEDESYIDSTIIDGDSLDCVVAFNDAEDRESILRGFTITNGYQGFGGGIDVQDDAGPQLIDLLVVNNHATIGAGIYNSSETYTLIRDCTIRDNHASSAGGGLMNGEDSGTRNGPIEINNCIIEFNSANYGGGVRTSAYAASTFHNVLIHSNRAHRDGGGIYFKSGDNYHTFINVTITENVAENAGGIFQTNSSGTLNVSLNNSIVYNNEPPEIVLETQLNEYAYNIISFTYSDIEGGEESVTLDEGDGEVIWGDGNIDEDPLFVDADEGDYHLTEDSPCIDTGDPDSPEDPDGTQADMGAFPYLRDPMIINVPEDYETIQEAIDRSRNDDTVLVAPGRYVENITISHKSITLLGNPDDPNEVIIDGDSSDTVLLLSSNATCEIRGFTIQNGVGPRGLGGGIRIQHCDPYIADCIIRNNYTEGFGSAIYASNSSPVIENCLITENVIVGYGTIANEG